MELLTPLLLVIVLIAVGFLILRQNKASVPLHDPEQEDLIVGLEAEKARLSTDLALAQQSLAHLKPLEAEVLTLRENNAKQEAQLAKLSASLEERDKAEIERKAQAARTEEALRADIELLKDKNGQAAELAASLKEQLARLEETLDKERSQAAEKLQAYERAQEQFTNHFKALSADILKEQGQQFGQANQQKLNDLLAPFKQQLESFSKRVNDIHTEDSKHRAELGSEIKRLAELGTKMNKEAENLTKALKGNSQKQGAWGEMILEKVLEESGLRKDHEFFIQESFKDESGKTLRPDVLIRLPNGRDIIVDSKVSLISYDELVAAEDEDSRSIAAKRLTDSVKSHIKDLSSKDYSSLTQGLDYVLLFIPIEGAMAAALTHDPSLQDFAFKNRVLLTSPNTLHAILRAVHIMWQVERREQNAQKIADQAAKMYDKFVGFVKDLENVGKHLGQTQKAWDGAYNKLSDGRGNVVRQLEQLKAMGVQPKGDLPPELVEAAQAESPALEGQTPALEGETKAQPLSLESPDGKSDTALP